MEDYKVVVDNIDEFIIRGLDEALFAALEKACLIVEADAKEACPTGDGQLRQSITHDIDKNKYEGVIGTNVEYAPYVEIGTGIYSSEGTGRQTPWCYKDEKTGEFYWTRGQHPRPFLQPALELNKDKINKCFEGII